jgi:hypothetical protein
MRYNLSLVAALLVERAGYRQRGLHARADLVTEQLRALGHVDDEAPVETAAVEPVVERAVKRRAKRRDV